MTLDPTQQMTQRTTRLTSNVSSQVPRLRLSCLASSETYASQVRLTVPTKQQSGLSMMLYGICVMRLTNEAGVPRPIESPLSTVVT